MLFDFCCSYYLWWSKGTKNIWHLQIFVQKSFTSPLQFLFLRVRLTILGSPTQTNVVFVVGCSAEARVAFMTPSVIWCGCVADAHGNFHYVNVRFCFVSSTAEALFFPVLVSGTTFIILYLLALFSLFCFFVLRLFFRNFISVIYPLVLCPVLAILWARVLFRFPSITDPFPFHFRSVSDPFSGLS